MPRIVIPFNSGVREDVDPKVMPDGALKRVENLRMRRDGRLGLRFGYTAAGVTVPSGNGMTAFDLIGWNGRILALGGASNLAVPTPIDVYEYVNQTQYKWRPTDNEEECRLNQVTEVRDVGRVPAQAASIATCDVSAGGGLVCMTWQPASDTSVHIFNPDTDSTVLITEIAGLSVARTLYAGSTFFILGVVGATIALYSFNPATDTDLVQLTNAFATGDSILRFDATVSEDGASFIVGLARSTPTVTLRLFNSSGTATQSITGPAVTLERLSVYRQATRVHLLAGEADDQVDLYTYLISGGSLENTSLGLSSAATTTRQPCICVSGQGTNLFIIFDDGTDIHTMAIAPSTHAVVTDLLWRNVSLMTKPATCVNTEVFGGLFSENSTTSTNFIGVAGVTQINPTEMIGCATDRGLGSTTFAPHLPHIARDRSVTPNRFYWPKLVHDQDRRANPVVSEFLVSDTGRRQTAAIDNQLYLTAGAIQVFGGRQLVEAGFLNRPFVTVSGTTGGSKTPGGLYLVACVFEWYDEQGRRHQSEPSDVHEVTLTAAQNAISVTVHGPLSSRCNATNQVYGSAAQVVFYCSLAAPDKQLLREDTAFVSPGTFGEDVVATLTSSDAALEDEEVIYTQGSSGARSGPNPFVAPLPAASIWPSADKLVTGRTPQDAQVQESRAAFPGEPITWAQNLGGIGSAPERVLAVARLDERRVSWTATGLFEFTGEGLDINGVGDVGFPRRLPAPGGLHGGRLGWRSIVETSIGIFFQLAADKIYLVPRGGGAPVWIGKAVRDTLASFPIITSATYIKRDQTVCFTCNNSGETDAVILTYDIEAQLWTVDTELTEIASSCEYDGRLVTLREGAVYLQNTTHPADAFIATVVETGTLYPFGQGREGQIDDIQLFIEFRGACNVICSMSFDDGQSYTALATKALTGLTVGQTYPLKWGPNAMRGDRIRLKFETTTLSGATEQIVYNYAVVHATPHEVSAGRPTAQKG